MKIVSSVMRKLILASGSPRRKEILEKGGYFFDVVTSDKESSFKGGLSPEKFALRCALDKTEDVYNRVAKGTGAVVLGADTVVALGGEILGKPDGENCAREMLAKLSGKTHTVITAYAIISDGMRESGCVETRVNFNELTDEVIDEYIASGLYKGKAGAYGIQDGYSLVKSYEGDYDNVVGLPLTAIDGEIKEFLK